MSLFDEEFEEDDSFSLADDNVEASTLLPPRETAQAFGFEKFEQQILGLITANKMPHALIFSGPEGIGKATFAYRLARFLFKHGVMDAAQDSLFGDAPALPSTFDVPEDDSVFRRVASGGHPDLMVAERQQDEKKSNALKKNLDADTIRKITPFLRMTASEGGWRVVIVDDAETMSLTAQDSLLKILEEPPPRSLLILITARIGAFKPTIRSRCRVLSFTPPEEDVFNNLVSAADPNLSKNDLALLHSLSNGSPGRALALVEEGGMEMVQTVLAPFEDWPKMDGVKIHQLAENIGRFGNDNGWAVFQTLIQWLFQSLVFARVQGVDILPPALRRSPFPQMLGSYDILALSEAHDKARGLLAQTDHANLDRRQAVLSIYSLLSA